MVTASDLPRSLNRAKGKEQRAKSKGQRARGTTKLRSIIGLFLHLPISHSAKTFRMLANLTRSSWHSDCHWQAEGRAGRMSALQEGRSFYANGSCN